MNTVLGNWTYWRTEHIEKMKTLRNWTYWENEHTEKLNTQRKWTHWRNWTHRENEHTEKMNTLRKWTHWETELTEKMNTLNNWTHRENEHTEKLNTLRNWIYFFNEPANQQGHSMPNQPDPPAINSGFLLNFNHIFCIYSTHKLPNIRSIFQKLRKLWPFSSREGIVKFDLNFAIPIFLSCLEAHNFWTRPAKSIRFSLLCSECQMQFNALFAILVSVVGHFLWTIESAKLGNENQLFPFLSFRHLLQ